MVGTAILLVSSVASAEPIFGLTAAVGGPGHSLVVFDSATPGSVTTIGPVAGVTAGDQLVGIDIRPANGDLYAFGVNLATGTARVYTLNEATAAATLVSILAADPADTTSPFPFTTVSGTQFGMDFNPVVDRLRVTSTTGQNLRINVDNGLTQLDVPLVYAAGDPNAGDSPIVPAVAYSNNFAGATTTTLRGVDVGQSPQDLLVVHTNPNGGTLTSLLDLPFNVSGTFEQVSYDVSGLTGTPYFYVGGFQSSLYQATPAGVVLIGFINVNTPLAGIAAPVGAPIPEPATGVLLGLGFAAALRARSQRKCRAAEVSGRASDVKREVQSSL
jgi:hypothetical protein